MAIVIIVTAIVITVTAIAVTSVSQRLAHRAAALNAIDVGVNRCHHPVVMGSYVVLSPWS